MYTNAVEKVESVVANTEKTIEKEITKLEVAFSDELSALGYDSGTIVEEVRKFKEVATKKIMKKIKKESDKILTKITEEYGDKLTAIVGLDGLTTPELDEEASDNVVSWFSSLLSTTWKVLLWIILLGILLWIGKKLYDRFRKK
jgi:hypothetical protein